jgi:prophage regulatory protein
MDKPHVLIRRDAVEARTGLRRSTLYELIGDGRFPKPVHIAGTRSVSCIEAEGDSWIKDQIAAARGIANS